MKVVKRSGDKEPVSFDKVLHRVRKAGHGLSISPDVLAQQVLSQIYDGVKTEEIDDLTSQLAASLSTNHPDWAILAARIAISNHQKKTSSSFCETMLTLSSQKNPITKEEFSYIHPKIIALCKDPEKSQQIEAAIHYNRDFSFDFFGFKTLERSYLLKGVDGVVRERPQHLWMRVSLGLWPDHLERAFETYDLLSQKMFTHATPTLFNAGTPREQLSSCFLLAMHDDSIAGIYKTLSDCAKISKYAGGIGLHSHNIRARGSPIRGTNGMSNGIVPMLRVFNNTARYVDQCFTPDTIIVTKKGLRRISDIQKGDQVLTSGGTESIDETGKHYIDSYSNIPVFCNVSNIVIHNYTGKILEVSFNTSKTIQVTPSHPFLALQQNSYDYIEIEKLNIGDSILNADKTITTITNIKEIDVNNINLYDLEVENTHDYMVFGAGIAHNGGGKRNGSFAIYLEPWHADIEDFLKMKLPTGAEEERARDLFYALWIPDLFMKRVQENGQWSLFCPDSSPGLADVHNEQFEELYTKYEKEGRALKVVDAQKLWFQILDAQMETGTPYLVYKDAANRKSNQQNVGTIKSSNLCVAPETYILTDKGQFQIYELEGQKVNVWNGEKWSKTIVHKTGEQKHLLKVTIQVICEGIVPTNKTIYCTGYHKFILPTHKNIKDCERIDAILLKEGMCLKGFYDDKKQYYEPKVISVEDYGRYDDTYCFNEPENHAGIFNGVLTGNCSEIIEYSDANETAVCNLASLSLPAYVKGGRFDFDELRRVTKVAVRNLNRVIDINYYPTPETERSNMRHRPIGLGVQGLADVFALCKLEWESEEAAKLNQLIFEHMYYAALEESANIAKEEGVYESFAGSPASQGRLQPDLWSVTPITEKEGILDWTSLRNSVKGGIRNSLLLAPMPTASTSQILGNNECFEPFTSNLYTRRTLAGEFIIVNKYLLQELRDAGIWSDQMKQEIIVRNGSVQGIAAIPEEIQRRYKTAWELKQRCLIDMAAARGAFICQSQSLNLFVADATYSKLTSMHFYAWQAGLKTGCYYLRTKAPVMAQKFTIDPRFASGLTSSLTKTTINSVIGVDSDLDSDSDSDTSSSSEDEEEDEETRREKLEKLAEDFAAQIEKAKAAAESGQECLMCGS